MNSIQREAPSLGSVPKHLPPRDFGCPFSRSDTTAVKNRITGFFNSYQGLIPSRDLSMILCDPFAINTLSLSTIRHLQELVSQETLPRVRIGMAGGCAEGMLSTWDVGFRSMGAL